MSDFRIPVGEIDARSSPRRGRTITILFAFLLSGCAATGAVKQVERLESVGENPRFLIVTPDVKYYLLPTGGVPQLHAEWTEAARENFVNSLLEFAGERNIEIVSMPPSGQLDETEIAYQNLYSAVGSTVLTHHYGTFKLSTKQGTFDWSLGPGVSAIGAKYDADYALFSFYRDYQATGGRVAFSIFAAMAGVGVLTGVEVGYASLIDLRTGDIVWFNQILSGTGELREPDKARAAVDGLFRNMPTR